MKKTALLSSLTIAAFTTALTACGGNGDTESTDPTPAPTATATAPAVAEGEIREPADGASHADVATGIRVVIPSWPEMTDDEIAVALNAGCDGLDARSEPDDGVQAIAAYGVTELDAAFGLLSAIVSYCPEHTELLGGPS